MARTFIGELVLRLKDEMSGKAKTAASNLDTSIDKIQRAAQQLNRTSWGGQFEERLRKLGTSAGDIDKLRTSWEQLNTSISSRNLSKALAGFERTNFKLAAVNEFAALASKAKEADENIGKMHGRWKAAMTDMAVYSTTGALMYGGVNALRGAIEANAGYQRELFRQENASLPTSDRLRIADRADKLTTQYPSAGIVDVMEMARAARNMMGTTDRGLQILPDLVKGLVALQTAKGVDAAPEELSRLLRAIDNSGKNSEGDLGIKDTREIIAGLIRAAQIEGNELNVGEMWTFMRRAKIAGPGFSTDFLANVAPGLVQDMTAAGAGTALSSAFQAFVIGSNAVASKKNIAEQKRIGIRTDDGLVNSQLMGENPYQWAKDVLLPALQKDGVDINNDTALAESIANLSRNTPATAMLTKMLQQREQLDKTIGLYRSAKGLDAANDAMAKDPFVAWRGFAESWRELATAIKGMPEAVSGLNMLTGGLQNFATALRNNDGGAQALLAGAGLGAGVAAWKVTAGIWGLITAGSNLNAAAVALQAAAASLGGSGAVDGLTDGPNKKKSPGGFWKGLGVATVIGSIAALLNDSKSIPQDEFQKALADMRKRQGLLGTASEAGDRRRQMEGLTTPYNPNTPGLSRYFEQEPRLKSPYESATDAMQRRQAFEADTGPRGNTPGLGDIFKPSVDLGDASAAATEANRIGGDIKNALNVSARPTVDNASLRETLALVNAIKSGLQGIGASVQAAHSSVSRAMNRNFTDQGVVP